jgi:hypothetical protein
MLKWENMITIEKAKKLRDEYLFGTKTLEEADSLRRKTEELFNKGTSMLGRKIAQTQRLAKALESQIEGVLAEGEKPEGAQVELKDVANMTKVMSALIPKQTFIHPIMCMVVDVWHEHLHGDAPRRLSPLQSEASSFFLKNVSAPPS